MEHLQAAVLVGLLLCMCVFNESGVFLDSEVRILTLKKKNPRGSILPTLFVGDEEEMTQGIAKRLMKMQIKWCQTLEHSALIL